MDYKLHEVDEHLVLSVICGTGGGVFETCIVLTDLEFKDIMEDDSSLRNLVTEVRNRPHKFAGRIIRPWLNKSDPSYLEGK